MHPEHAEDDSHNLMIARLNNEKAVREDLEKQRKELVAKKQALIAENKRRKEDLASLDEQLKKFSKDPSYLYPKDSALANQFVKSRYVALISAPRVLTTY